MMERLQTDLLAVVALAMIGSTSTAVVSDIPLQQSGEPWGTCCGLDMV